MVKTLRITGFLTVLSAIAIIALIINSGVQTNPNIEDFLNGPQVVEIFKSSIGSRPVTSNNQEHPLVLQAKAFADILKPPEKKVENRQPTRTPTTRTVVDTITKNTPKFDVISTIYYAQNRDASLALIREGKQTRWISQGSTVSHLLIAEIKDGLVIVKNDEETFELKTPEKKFSAPIPSTSDRTRITDPVPYVNEPISTISPPARTPRTKPVTTPKTTVVPKTIVEPRTMDEEEKLERVEELYEKLKMISDSTAINPDGSEATAEDNAIRMHEIITEFKKANTNIDSEEAQRLIDLGAYLEHVQDRDESN